MKSAITELYLLNKSNIDKSTIEFTIPDYCPKCHAPFVHNFSKAITTDKKKIEIFMYCNHCSSSFITKYNGFVQNPSYTSYGNNAFYWASDLEKCEPIYPENKLFSEKIANLSPMFQNIYNQANTAESYSLNEIAGMGYRKALEFLVKDFCIHLNPNKKAEIENILLGKCISTYISDEKIKNLATASTWIGNDETHYVRKHIDKDIQDMKKFIHALLYFIEYQLTVEEATTFTTP